MQETHISEYEVLYISTCLYLLTVSGSLYFYVSSLILCSNIFNIYSVIQNLSEDTVITLSPVSTVY